MLWLLLLASVVGSLALAIHRVGKATDAQWMAHMREGVTPEALAKIDAQAAKLQLVWNAEHNPSEG